MLENYLFPVLVVESPVTMLRITQSKISNLGTFSGARVLV